MRKVPAALSALLVALALGGCSSASVEHVGVSGFTVEAPAIQVDQETTGEEDEQPPDASEATAPAEKPATNTGSDASGASASKPAPSNTGTASKPAASAHEHSWAYHEAVTEKVWVSNEVWVGWYVCGHCGAKTYSSSDAKAHQREHILETGVSYAYGTDGYYEDQGHYETQTVRAAYYSCTCGATKK